MWDSSFGGVRLAARRQKKLQSARKKAPGAALRLRRITAEFKADLGSPELCRILSLDFTSERLWLYSPTPLDVGTRISITIEYPSRFFCRGKVVASRDWTREAGIVRDPEYGYRAEVLLMPADAEERAAIDRFVSAFGGDSMAALAQAA